MTCFPATRFDVVVSTTQAVRMLRSPQLCSPPRPAVFVGIDVDHGPASASSPRACAPVAGAPRNASGRPRAHLVGARLRPPDALHSAAVVAAPLVGGEQLRLLLGESDRCSKACSKAASTLDPLLRSATPGAPALVSETACSRLSTTLEVDPVVPEHPGTKTSPPGSASRVSASSPRVTFRVHRAQASSPSRFGSR